MFIIKIPLTPKEIKQLEKKFKSETKVGLCNMEANSNIPVQDPQYSKVVTKFAFEWVNPNNDLDYVCCWNCAYKILYKESIGIPVDIIDQSFRCYGYFCSWECAARYLYDKYFIDNPIDYYNQYSLLCIAYQKINQCTKVVLNKAPPKEVLKEFGGTVDYNDYRNTNRVIDFYKLPLVPLNIYIMNMTKGM